MEKLRKYNNILFITVLTLMLALIMDNPVYAATSNHNYYKGLSAQQAAMADSVAQSIAVSIMSNPAYTTDLQRVQAAASIVASYAARGTYGRDVNNYYRSPFGVFCANVYTCAGTTRALGRVLDFMGFPYIHVNENQYSHQWCVLTMDGQIGYADGMPGAGGIAGYGQLQSGMMLSDGSVIYFY